MRKALAVAAVFAGLWWMETVRPLRTRTQPRGRRTFVNVAMAALSGVAVVTIQRRVVERACDWVERTDGGVVRMLGMPGWLTRAVGVVLLDYTLWHWHRLCHVVPLLWRVHAAHHADVDLDASTALRFHIGEMLASIPFRAAQIVVIGIDRTTLRTWEAAVFVAILMHHANVRLPRRLDAALARVVITPRLHGIHHAIRPNYLDRNFGTLLSVWDRLHGTRTANLARDDLAIGLEVVLGTEGLGLLDALAFPGRNVHPR